LALALRAARIHGLTTNRDQLIAILESEEFLSEELSTAFLNTWSAPTPAGSRGVPLAAGLAIVAAAAARRKVIPKAPTSWRNVPSQPQRITFTDGSTAEFFGTRRGFTAEGVKVVSVHSAEEPGDDGAAAYTVVLETDGVRTRFTATVRGLPGHETVDVDSIHGHTALTREPRFLDPADRVEEGSLLAPMPGTVVTVHASVGDVVEEGQPLLVLEAMKMQHTIAAPHAGTVTELDVAVGDQVTGGTVLAVVHNPDQES
jgi:propionyl-CoA carboxylase alpha chain